MRQVESNMHDDPYAEMGAQERMEAARELREAARIALARMEGTRERSFTATNLYESAAEYDHVGVAFCIQCHGCFDYDWVWFREQDLSPPRRCPAHRRATERAAARCR